MIRKNNYNLIRFILAICVIFCHNIELLDGNRNNEIFTVFFKTNLSLGSFAVNLFFLISGYLIVKSWDKNENAWSFLSNRILRIYPGFIVASIISCFVIGALADNTHYFEQFKYKYFIFNLLVLKIPITPKIFKASHYPYINGAMWTINNEFICYLLVLVLGILSFVKNKIGWIVFFTTFFSAIFLVNLFHVKIINNFLSNYFVADFFDVKLIFSFFIGGTYYLFGKNFLNRKSIFIVSTVLMFIFLFKNLFIDYTIPLFVGYIVLSIAESTIPLLSEFNTLPDISYGVYLYGWPITKFLIYSQPKINYWLLNVESLILAILLGLFSWYLVEKPFIRLKKIKYSEKTLGF
jgi:peptidoglycan/LPS O-acetylase OafA/YrhL